MSFTLKGFERNQNFRSVPNISLIVINLISPQELAIFVLKCDLAVMLLLSENVPAHLLNV